MHLLEAVIRTNQRRIRIEPYIISVDYPCGDPGDPRVCMASDLYWKARRICW